MILLPDTTELNLTYKFAIGRTLDKVDTKERNHEISNLVCSLKYKGNRWSINKRW